MLHARDVTRIGAREVAAREIVRVERLQLAFPHQLRRELALLGVRPLAPAYRFRLGQLPYGLDPLRDFLREAGEWGEQVRSRGHAGTSFRKGFNLPQKKWIASINGPARAGRRDLPERH